MTVAAQRRPQAPLAARIPIVSDLAAIVLGEPYGRYRGNALYLERLPD
jgi:hypothetical protein